MNGCGIVRVVFVLLGATLGVSGADRLVLSGTEPPPNAIWLDSLGVAGVSQGWGRARAGRSVEGGPLGIGGVVYAHGVGTHARSEMIVDLKQAAVRFVSDVGVDDEKDEKGSVVFEAWVDGERRAVSGVLRGDDPPGRIDVDLRGARELRLVVDDADDGIDFDHADWAGALLYMEPGAEVRPAAVRIGGGPPMEIAHGTLPEPSINGPRIVGATPGRPFLFLVPATGEGPLSFQAEHLPRGLSIDSATGIIRGSVAETGESLVTLTVTGSRGTARRKLKVVAGERKLALTPPMGWNSWNCWATSVDAEKIRDAADWMVRSGLAAHGYQYVNIDDAWQGSRDAAGEITANEKFGDMKALADYVHSKGLKLGIYSSPGPKTCAGFEGTFGHEEQDARTWAQWGIDYLKYDWCSYGSIYDQNPGIESMKAPYRVMRTALDGCGRDIVYSFCQYGMGGVWEWGAEVGGNLWRTTGDINDTWSRMTGIGFGQDGIEAYAGPGHWNDPDMLVVGLVGWGPDLHPSELTPNEQITHVTLWSLLAAPMLVGCDMGRMDAFTTDLLCNDEVIAVNQDPLGRQASRRSREGDCEVWARPLWDDTVAVGLFNRGSAPADVAVRWRDIGVGGRQPIRDLWRKREVGVFSDAFSAEIPAHGAGLYRIGTPTRTDW